MISFPMGWNTSAKTKRLIASRLAARRLSTDDIKTDVVVIDVNASFRALFGARTYHMTPVRAASAFKELLQKVYSPQPLLWVWCFDDPTRVPELRNTFHATKRYKAAERDPKPGVEVRVGKRNYPIKDAPVENTFPISPSFMPSCGTGTRMWSRIWNSPCVKHRLWCAFADALELLYPEDVIDRPDGVLYMGKGDPAKYSILPCKHISWGEADAKAFHWANGCESDVIVTIETIDWDMFIQIVAEATHPKLQCRIASIRVGSDGTEYFSSKSAPSNAVRAHEIIYAPQLELTAGQRRDIAFWSLAAGGGDYSGRITSDATAVGRIEVIIAGGGKRVIGQGEGSGRRYARYNVPRDIVLKHPESTSNALWTLRYYGGWDSARKPPGPPPPLHHEASYREVDVF